MGEVFKVIVAGGRDFGNYTYLKESLDRILEDIKEPIVIVSGGASGADGFYRPAKRWFRSVSEMLWL